MREVNLRPGVSRSPCPGCSLRMACLCASRDSPFTLPPLASASSLVRRPARTQAAACWASGGGNQLQRLRAAAPRITPKPGAPTLQFSSARPNPSLGTDPLRRASLPVWRAGLCCTTRASRPASAVGVSSNVRQHGQQSSSSPPVRGRRRTDTRSGQVIPDSSGQRIGLPRFLPTASRCVPFQLGPDHKSSRGPLPALPISPCSGRRCTRRKRRAMPSPIVVPGCTCACCLTLRSAATPHGKPLGRRGTFAYAAPRRPSASPRGSRLAQTLGVAGSRRATRSTLCGCAICSRPLCWSAPPSQRETTCENLLATKSDLCTVPGRELCTCKHKHRSERRL